MSVTDMSTPEDNLVCRRAENVDRRQAHFKAAVLSYFNARRQIVRRDVSDAVNHLGEIVKPCSAGMLCGILVFLVLDAMLSLSILHMSGSEQSPLAQILYDNTWQSFFLMKSLVAAASVIFLAVYKNVDMLKTLSRAQALMVFISFYIAMLVYEVVLLA